MMAVVESRLAGLKWRSGNHKVTTLSSAGDVYWPLTDNQGTVRQLAFYDSGSDDTTIEKYWEYDSFGNVTSETAAAVDHLFGYTGRAFDDETGLQNNLHRWYDPVTGRWASEDPIGFAAGDANLYPVQKRFQSKTRASEGQNQRCIEPTLPIPKAQVLRFRCEESSSKVKKRIRRTPSAPSDL